jgi:arginase family enzyme
MILVWDGRMMNPDEERLVWATNIAVVPKSNLGLREHADRLARDADCLYLHIDLDVLDESLVPGHPSRVPGGPDIDDVLHAIEIVLETRRVGALGLVSVFSETRHGDRNLAAATTLLSECLVRWSSV